MRPIQAALIISLLFSRSTAFGRTLDSKSYIAVLSSPGQASTALSYIFSVLPQLHCPLCVLESCDGVHEALNPRCSWSCPDGFLDDKALERCMGSQGRPFSQNIWKDSCFESDWQSLIQGIVRNQITLVKDVFSPTKLPLFVAAGFQVVVAFKPPWLTFPTSVSGMYENINDEYCIHFKNSSLNGERVLYPAFGSVLWSLSCFPEALTDLTSSNSPREGKKKRFFFTSIPPPCFMCRATIAHYIFHFHLLSSAAKYGVPVIDTSQLFSLPPKLLRKYLKRNLPASLLTAAVSDEKRKGKQGSSDLTARILDSMVNRTMYFRSSKVIRAHSFHEFAPNTTTTGGLDGAVSRQIFRDKAARFAKSGCGECLSRIATACSKLLPGCFRFNSMYGVDKYMEEFNHN
jgi:hypothetical protein